MKSFFTKASPFFLAAFLLAVVTVPAQQKREKKERIIIEQKGDKKEKLIIEIDGENVKVNGRPVDQNDSNIIIRKYGGDYDFGFEHFRSPRIRVMPFGEMEPHGGWNQEFRERNQKLRMQSDQWRKRSSEMKERMQELKLKMQNRAFLGVGTDEDKQGAKITEVQKESAAEAAGLKEGDVITKVNDTEINKPEDLSEIIRKQKPGDEVTINYLRDGKKKSAKAKLGTMQMPKDFNFEFEMPELPGMPEMPEFKFDKLLELEYLNPWNGEQYNGNLQWFHNRPRLGATIQDTEEGNGVKILEVDEGSAAAKSGLQPDDLITEINGKKVTNVQEAREALREKNASGNWRIQTLRAGKPVTIEVKIPKELKKSEL
jgi:serine protease Do